MHSTPTRQVVILKLNGNLDQQGFQVSLEIAEEGQYPSLAEDGYLPANPLLGQQLQQWQQHYQSLVQPQRGLTPYKIHYDGSINPLDDCRHSARQVEATFVQWLRSPSFRDLEQHLCRVLAVDDIIRILIRSGDAQMQALPWHLWPVVDTYPQAEVAMGAPRFQHMQRSRPATPTPQPVSILAVLGDRTHIDIDTDRHVLNQLPGAKVTLLVEPRPEQLHEQLYTRSWDILFFAGHSDTLAEGAGILQLNPTTTLTVEELKYGVKKAIANGLQLAIFNSCSGVGLAHALADLQLPQMIVMRQALPDHVAHTFLKSFLDAFAHGSSLYQAERQARERLAGLEQTYPCASWLPMIYQHPAQTPPSWRSLQHPEVGTDSTSAPAPVPIRRPSTAEALTRLTVVSFIVTSLILAARFLGALQPLEFWAFNRLMQWKPVESPDPRLVLVTVTEDDIRFQDENNYQRNGSLADAALAEVLTILQSHSPSVIGLDIIRDRPLSQEAGVLAQQLPLFFNCTGAVRALNTPAIPAPPGTPADRIGFADADADPDHFLRRHHIGMSPTVGCETDKALSYQLTRTYLADIYNLSDDRTPQGTLTIGDRPIPPLRPHHGPYHRNTLGGGYEILLHYRQTEAIAEMLTLEDLITGAIPTETLDELIRDRIVLIGTTARSFKDYHLTPHGEMAGVEVHGHMVSQLISAVLDDRPLLSVWPQWADGLWIFLWSSAAGGLALVFYRRSRLIGVAGVTLCGLTIACVWGLRLGIWLPLMPTAIALTAVMAILQHQSTIPIPLLRGWSPSQRS